jgi:hypothetical protein
MTVITKSTKNISVSAYTGDAKTLLAFNLPDKKSTKNLAGFTVLCEPDGQTPFFLLNTLQFEKPGDHTQNPKEPANSSINAPFHKFRWLHVPGSVHQGLKPFFGKYTYTVTARYFDDKHSLLPIDPALSVSVTVNVGPFRKKGLELGFTRGFTQSQAFVHHFGLKALIRPTGKELLFDTTQVSGTDAEGNKYTYEEEYEWLGYTARERIFDLLNEVLNDATLNVDVFAYDLNEPDLMKILLKLAKQGRIRVFLDDAALHHSTSEPKPEDQFETLFAQAAKKPAEIKRAHFSRYAHDKVFIVSKNGVAVKVLTGSTNFSVTGLYVNSNHVLVFTDGKVAAKYAELFQTAWDIDWTLKGALAKFVATPLSSGTFSVATASSPRMEITFAPHDATFAEQILNDVATRVTSEGKKAKRVGSVLFAVMQVDNGTSPVYTALSNVHADERIFSFGISDTTSGIALYTPGRKTGVLVTGKPAKTQLPPPFNQVPSVGLGHQIHHKFVVCGFNGDDPVVYCGSSNLALGGEENNGDNLLAIQDGDVATVFAIEALALVDHFQFLDRSSGGTTTKAPAALKSQAAIAAGWFLSTSDKWAAPYFDAGDLHNVDRVMFGG